VESLIITAIITGILGPIIVIIVKNKLAKQKPKSDPLIEVMEFNKLIDQQLDILLKELHCDRTWIIQFHNGGNLYPTGKSIQKFSIFYEHLTPNTPSIKDTLHNIPVSLFSKSLSKLYEDGEILINDYDENKHQGLEIYNNDLNTKSYYMFALFDLNDNFIGILGVEYIKKKTKISEDSLEFIKHKTSSLGTLFNSYLYTNNTLKK
jgi:hypothetical protein